MKFSVVGNREGQAVIHWLGVMLSALLISGVYSLPIAGFYWGVGFFDARSFILLPLIVAGIIGTSIHLGLKRPAAELPAIA